MRNKVDWSSFRLIGFVFIFFALFMGVVISAFVFAQNKQKYIKDVAFFVAGDVYAVHEDAKVRLSDMTRGNLGATMTSGDRKYADKKMNTTGEKIIVYSVREYDGSVYQLVVEELENTKTRVTIEGRQKTHSYDTPTRYKTYYRLLTTEDDFRGNVEVDTIPVVE